MTVTHVSVGNLNLDLMVKVPSPLSPDDVVVAEELYVGPGGSAANYAVAAARAGGRAKLVAYTTRHAEALGLLANLLKEGVNLSSLRIVDRGYPGFVLVIVYSDGRLSMVKNPGVNKLLRGDEVLNALPADVLHFASVRPDVVLNACSKAQSNGLLPPLVSFDPGSGIAGLWREKVVEVARKYVRVLMVNLSELYMISNTTLLEEAAKLLGGSLEMILVKMGAQGAALVTRKEIIRVRSYKHGSVVDTTGAGDVFDAYFNHYMVETGDVEKALAAAAVAAGIKVTRMGAQNAPCRAQVDEILNKIGLSLIEGR